MIPPIGLSLALGRIVELESAGIGLSWDTAGDTSDAKSVSISYWTSFVMMNVGTVACGVVSWWLGQVFPGEYGVRRPWWFPCQLMWRRLRTQGRAQQVSHND